MEFDISSATEGPPKPNGSDFNSGGLIIKPDYMPYESKACSVKNTAAEKVSGLS